MQQTDLIASTHLGKKYNGSEEYNPSLLVPIPRDENRKQYDINSQKLPFLGWDVWHAYEFSTLTENGIPVTRLMKIKYNCNSDFLIESKSLKLYLNSFNMTKCGESIPECLKICKNIIEKDLSQNLKTSVEINFIENNTDVTKIFQKYVNLYNLVDFASLSVNDFKENPVLLELEQLSEMQTYYLMFDSLRSNCRVTHQPDFGDVFIYYKSKKHFKEDGLVKYLSSFRNEFHFHEECCEMIFKRLYDLLDDDDELFVCALYTRRGGIDINPCRWSKNCNIDDFIDLIDLFKYTKHGVKQ